jgi:NADH:ubiquinone oxidoreductase subunit F (NADH-binding)
MTTTNTPDDLVGLLDAAGLTGRGGAAFSTATKVRAAHDYGAHLVVNACDGEVGAVKDAHVVEHHLDELVQGARLLTGPRRRRLVRFAAHRGSRTAAALDRAGVDVLEVPDRYVSSEETSLISLANGGLARPMTKRRPFVLGGGRDSTGRRVPATVVLNAETVWRVAQVAEHGPGWFRSFGTPEEPGPRLVALTGAVDRPGVLDTEAGVPVADLLDAARPVPGWEVVVVGGLGGVLVTADEARGARWSTSDLTRYGGSLGPGVIDVLDPHLCPLDVVTSFLTYAAGETAGQCGPCMFGVPSVAEGWRRLVETPSRRELETVRSAAALLPDRGACRFPDGVGRFAVSALRVLEPHLAAHASGGCPSERSRTSAHRS